MLTKVRTALVGALILSLAACGKTYGPDDAVPVAKVSGTVSFKGTPMAGAVVTFHPVHPKGSLTLAPIGTADEATARLARGSQTDAIATIV